MAARWNDNKTIRTLSCIIILIGSFVYLVSQWTAMGTVMEYILGVDYRVGVIAGAIIITAYVIAGGMLASMWTNFFQMIIMFVFAVVLLVVCFNACGGFTTMNLAAAAVNPEYTAVTSPSLGLSGSFIFSYAIMVCVGYGGQPSMNTKFLMVRNKKDLKWCALIAVVAPVIGVSTFFAGIAGVALVSQGVIEAPAKADLILLSLISELFPTALGSCILVAVMAAVMSTAETYLFQSATSMTQDLLVKVFGVKWDDKTVLRNSRYFMAGVMVITVAMALSPPQLISELGAQAFGTFCGGFAATLYLSIRWQRVNTKAGIAGLLMGLIFGGVVPFVNSTMLGGSFLPAITTTSLGVVASAIAVVVVMLCTSREEPSEVFNFEEISVK